MYEGLSPFLSLSNQQSKEITIYRKCHSLPTADSKHFTKSKFPHNEDYNLQIICNIINSLILLGEEFNNAHLDTSFASIDPKIMKLHPIEGTHPESENCTKSH